MNIPPHTSTHTPLTLAFSAGRTGERISFGYLTSQKYTGQTAHVEVLRGGKELSLTIELGRTDSLVPLHLSGNDPSYLVVAGIVFTTCSEPYLHSEYGADYISESPVKLLDKLLHCQRDMAGQEVG